MGKLKMKNLDHDTVAFLQQNDECARTITKKQLGWLIFDTEHHSGNLFVCGQSVNYDTGEEYQSTFYVKMHDTWGDPEDPNEGPVVVHLYDPDEDLQAGQQSTDVNLYFKTGKAAADLYLNDEALVAIWKATR